MIACMYSEIEVAHCPTSDPPVPLAGLAPAPPAGLRPAAPPLRRSSLRKPGYGLTCLELSGPDWTRARRKPRSLLRSPGATL